MSTAIREPEISLGTRRVLAALLLSLGIHAAIIGFVRLKSGVAPVVSSKVLEVQMVALHAPTPPVPPLVSTVPKRIVRDSVAPVPVSAVVPLQPSPVQPPTSQKLPAIAVPLLVDETYYTAKQVDILPRPLHPIMPLYPQDAIIRNLEGSVILDIKLDASGQVESVKVSNSNPPQIFDQAAIDAFMKGVFAPAEKGGHPVKSLMQIKVTFALK